MTTPNNWSAWTESTLSGDAPVNGLIYGSQWVSHTLTFSFPTATSSWSTNADTGYGPKSGGGEPWSTHYEPLNPDDLAPVRNALAAWGNVADLTFKEVTETSSVVGDLRFAYSDTPGAQAWAYAPGNYVQGGDVWFGYDSTSHQYQWDAGTYEYMTAIHEIGHALGLKHPFEGTDYNSIVVDPSWDTRSFTVMSYSAVAGDNTTYFSYEPTTPMILDIAAIQHLYGANTSYHATNTTYTYRQGENYHQTLWDAGGIDTIAYVSTAGGTIDLEQGGGSQLGNTIYTQDANSNNIGAVLNVWIAYGAIIENAIGGSGDDTIVGNDVANMLNGGAGADTMSGGLGNDIYDVDNAGDRVIEATGGGTDTVWSSRSSWTLGANLENLRITAAGAANGTGNSGANTLYAGAGDNVLNGAGGTDTVSYYYAASGIAASLAIGTAQATGGSGSDTFVSIERLTGSNYNDRLTGNASTNVLSGGRGNDTLDGGTGADTLVGGDGNDAYTVDSSLDVVTETNAVASTGGVDIVYSKASSFTLGANVENMRIVTASSANATGNSLANVIYAGAGNNVMNGGSGTDTVSYGYATAGVSVSLATSAAQATGGSGTDTLLGFEKLVGSAYDDHLTGSGSANALYGGAGNDVLTGGGGSDALSGGSGNDRFRFFFPSDGRDTISDFVSGTDKIAVVAANFGLVAGSAAHLVVNGSPATTAATFVYSTTTGVLSFDDDGSGADVAVQLALLSNKPATLSLGDFVIGT